MSQKRKFTISVFSENRTGLLHSITIIFTRRKINIDSINSSESETPGIHRYTIVINTDEDTAFKVARQIEKLVDVLGAFLHEEDEVIHREIALYKVATTSFFDGNEGEILLRKHAASIIRVEKEFLVIEKTGWKEETQALLNELEPFGVLEFVRSGRVALTKKWTRLHQYFSELDKSSHLSG